MQIWKLKRVPVYVKEELVKLVETGNMSKRIWDEMEIYQEDIEQSWPSELKEFVGGLQDHISTKDGQWTVKGFIDVFQNIYTISSDTKIVSKILEIHLFPKIMEFAREYGYKIVLAEHQNYYPDISFVKADDESIKFAVDFKTTYRNPKKPFLCNGFTLGSHGKYFEDRTSTKNIQFPYGEYSGHFCLGIIYDRADGASIDETTSHNIKDLQSIASVVSGFQFFVTEKWRIARESLNKFSRTPVNMR